jgi:hypothetical protein
MLYAQRDKDGKIVSLTSVKTPDATKVTTAMGDEVIEFLNRSDDAAHPQSLLSLSDAGLVRALEDLINILIDKKIIRFTDLPVEVQKKITARQKLREKLSSDGLMVDDII